MFGIIPVLDYLIGNDPGNPLEEVVATLERERYYRRVVYLATFIEYVSFFGALWIVGTHALKWYDYLGFALSLGPATGVSINTTHELGHKTDRFERWLAKITLAPVAYGHFFVEHNRGHHVRVATPSDPASERYGESFWAFLPRTVFGNVASGHGGWKSSGSNASVIVISSEMIELIGLCHRVVVMRAGRLQTTLTPDHLTEEELIAHATGTH
ncbi:MAG: Alkane-1 monooxygenase (EC [uncultured Paraburkholderia sp.]|nr:MAG: Alkane-1 monooxygenase (EC [uncultured Paraburkholderia sp.]CAH2938830.1 MAG: Alkane-1 monooxygenase (EC [uncultured Paraburkholderia sp.]